MDEEMYDESVATSSKKKAKKSKKRKHEESDREEREEREESKSNREKKDGRKDRKGKGAKKDRKEKHERDEEDQRSDENSDDLFQQESIRDDGEQRLDEEASYELFDEEQVEQEEEEATNQPDETLDEPEPFSCVKLVQKQIKFALLPIAMGQELKVIKNILVFDWKYSFINELDGFLSYFANLKLVDEEYYEILDDLPYFYPHITADFYVFRPKVGEYLKATISYFEDSNKLINCSTNYPLTISIQLPEVISDELNRYLTLQQEIIFRIERIDYKQDLIEGAINERSLRLMEKHVQIRPTADESEVAEQETNLDNFFVN